MRILFIILISVTFSISLFSQPISNRSSDVITVQDGNLFAKNSFRPAVYNDTSAANSVTSLDSCGKLIFTYSDNSYWLRACSPKRWVKIGKYGDYRFGIEDNTSLQNRSINFNNHSLTMDSLNYFQFTTKTGGSYPLQYGSFFFRNDQISLESNSYNPSDNRGWGFFASPFLTEMRNVGFVNSGYVQVDTTQVILESDPTRLYIYHDSIVAQTTDNSILNLKIKRLAYNTSSSLRMMVIDSVTGQVYRQAIPISLVNNGISKSGDTTQLGGILIKNTTIDAGSTFSLKVTGSLTLGSSTAILVGENTGTGNGIHGSATTGSGIKGAATSGNAVFGIATSGVGGQFNTTNGTAAMQAYSVSTLAANLTSEPATTSAIVPVMNVNVGTTGTAANGIGGSIDMRITTTTTAYQLTNRIISKLSNATNATYTADLEFWGANNASVTRKAALSGAGQWTWDGYPFLTPQTDTTNIKPIGYNTTTGVIQPMANWISAGGGNENIQQTLDVGDTTNRKILYNGVTSDASTGTETFSYLPSNLNIVYPSHGTAMGFAGGWQRFNGVNTSPRPNVVATLLGYNHTLGGGRIDANEAAFAFRAETHFETGGSDLFEFHLPEVTTYGGTIKRPFSLYTNKATGGTAYNFYALDGFNTQATNGDVLFSFNGTGNYDFVGHGSNSQITLYDESLAGARYQLQVDGTDVFHNTFGNLQRFDSELYISDPYTNNPNIFIHDYRSTNNTAGIFFDLSSANAKRPIFMAANVTGGTEFYLENTGGTNGINIRSNISSYVSLVNTNASDPGGVGNNYVYTTYAAGAGAATTYIGASYGAGTGYPGSQLFIDAQSIPVVFYQSTVEKMRLATNGNLSIVSLATGGTAPTTTGTTKMVITDQNGLLSFDNIPSIGNTLYSGDGTLAGDRVVTGNNLSITFNDIFAYRINSDYNVIAKANGTGNYTEAIIGNPNQYWLGYTPTAGTFSKGAGVVIDTNNNVSLGTGLITSSHPLYTYGSAFAQGFTSARGNFYRVDNYTADQALSIEQYWINVDATSANVTITLPAASTAFGSGVGIQYVIRRVDASGNTITISRAGSDLINGATTTTLSAQYEVKEIQAVSSTAWAIK